MAECFLNDRVTLHCGDCREVLATLPENWLDACVTDPPYHLVSIVKRFANEKPWDVEANFAERKIDGQGVGPFARAARGFMGKVWDGGDVAFRPETWAAVYRVLKPGAHLVAMGGTRTYHRLACAIEDAGFEIRDTVSWLYGSGFPKSHSIGNGWGTALKPACELIVLARKPLSEGTVAANVLRWSVGALNIDGCRVAVTGQRPYDDAWDSDQLLCASCAERAESTEKPTTLATKASSATKFVVQTSNAKAENSPAGTDKTATGCCDGMLADITSINSNTVESGKIASDQSQKALSFTISTAIEATTDSPICVVCGATITPSNTPPIKPKQNGLQPTLQDRASTARPNARWPANLLHDGSAEVLAAFPDVHGAGAARNGSSEPRESNHENITSWSKQSSTGDMFRIGDSGSAARFFYTSKADSDDRLGSKHPTVKPLDLMQWLVRLVTPRGGMCLDPFAGTGTTGEAAWREGMVAVLIEAEAEYQADIRRRMALVLAGPDERQRESIKAKNLPRDDGPLFASRETWAEMWAKPFDFSQEPRE